MARDTALRPGLNYFIQLWDGLLGQAAITKSDFLQA